MRRRGRPVAEEITWTTNRQAPAAARQTMDMVLAALDEHYPRLVDSSHRAAGSAPTVKVGIARRAEALVWGGPIQRVAGGSAVEVMTSR